ncbi:unnamed protein product, partial [Scytosiphon promiscuus]
MARSAQKRKSKVLNWYRLPATGGWVPSARAGHAAVSIGAQVILFGGIVNGERGNELTSFDLHTRVWRRVTPKASIVDGPGQKSLTTAATAVAAVPGPRAFHVAWAFNGNVYIHGGEGQATGETGLVGNPDLDDVLGSVGRDPFAEEDGGAPVEAGRIATAANGRSAGVVSWPSVRSVGNAEASSGGERRPAVSVLEDLWKFDSCALQWERLSSRLAPLGRKGHTASVVSLRSRPHVLIFGGAPAGRRGLSNALYSADLALLSRGEGVWERHRPSGIAPAPRQGHTLTALIGGKRLVLFGGVAEGGELLRDIHVLETDGDVLSWSAVQAPVGDIPTPRHGHSACEVPVTAGYAAGVSGGGVLVFGGEGRTKEGQEVRSTDSHEIFLYDLKESRWQNVATGHAFPIGRHGHSMSSIVGWTPPSFHPDGALTAAEQAPRANASLTWGRKTATTPGQRHNNTVRVAEGGGGVGPGVGTRGGAIESPATTNSEGNIPSDAAVLQWGQKAPCCAVVFGGLNSMYVNPEMWVLPLRWVEKAVQLSPPPPEPETRQDEDGESGRGNRLGFAAVANIKTAGAVAAATARRRAAPVAVDRTGTRGAGMVVNATGGNRPADDAWRLFQAGGISMGARTVDHRRASLPGGLTAEAARRAQDSLHPYHLQQHQQNLRHETRENAGGELHGAVEREVDHDPGGMPGTAAEIEGELIRLKRIAYVAEKKLSAEVCARMHLEETNQDMQREMKELSSSKESAELELREEANRRQWHEGQKAKSRCASLERLLAEAYELINMMGLQHHLQVKSLMPGLYGQPQLKKVV